MECMLCPRRCGVDRSVTKGFCHMGDKIKVAKTMLHMWEEPSISTRLPEKRSFARDEEDKPCKKQQFEANRAENTCSAAERVENTRQSVDKTQNMRGSVNKTENTRGSVDNSENTRGSVDKTENMQGCAEKNGKQGGSGAIFFSGCSLGCVYCQNRDIRSGEIGKELSVQELADEMLALQEMGAYNINLVTPTHFADKIAESVSLIRDRLKIPIVYNTSGYELPETIERVSEFVDIFLTDMKYFSPEVSAKYSFAPDYYLYAKKSFGKMIEAQPKVIIKDGLMKKGIIMRHLVLPGLRRDSIKILEDVSINYDISSFKLSLMSQYTPSFCPDKYKELKRKITTFEYQSVLERAIELGYDGYMQDISSSTSLYTPDFRSQAQKL